jgi:hypothetical protein
MINPCHPDHSKIACQIIKMLAKCRISHIVYLQLTHYSSWPKSTTTTSLLELHGLPFAQSARRRRPQASLHACAQPCLSTRCCRSCAPLRLLSSAPPVSPSTTACLNVAISTSTTPTTNRNGALSQRTSSSTSPLRPTSNACSLLRSATTCRSQ